MAINDPNSQPNQAPKQVGTGFTNLQSIMNANQGNKLGQAVGSGIQQTGQQVQQGLQQGQNEFNDASQANQMGTAQQRENVTNILNDPTKATTQDVNQFAKYRSGQYAGPTGLTNINAISGQAQQAQQQGQSLGTDTGRQSLLQRYAASPGQYGAGAQRLDSVLLGSGNQQPLREARRSVSGLTQQVAGGEQAAEQQAQQYQTQAKNFGNDVTKQTSDAEAGVYNPAQQTAIANNIKDQQTQTAADAAAQAAQSGNQLSADALAALGLQAGDRTYGANLGADIAYQGGNTPANAMNVMSPEDFQKYSTLRNLMGESPVQQSQNPYQAGKIDYNKDQAVADIAAQKAKYEGELNPVLNQVNYGGSLASQGLTTPEAVQHQIDWLRGVYGNTWGNSAFGEQVNQLKANQYAPLLAQMQDIEHRYGGLTSLMNPDGSIAPKQQATLKPVM